MKSSIGAADQSIVFGALQDKGMGRPQPFLLSRHLEGAATNKTNDSQATEEGLSGDTWLKIAEIVAIIFLAASLLLLCYCARISLREYFRDFQME